jgi:CHAD domain-containing protein
MQRVLEECDKAAKDFAPDPVHDLRVALRRCRSMADGMMAVDPGPSWRQMKRAGRTLFRSLGDLRDVHIMQEWTEKLSAADDPVRSALLQHIAGREAELKKQAVIALQSFDRKRWQEWAQELPRRALRVRPGSPVFRHMALERWTEARELHRQAMRNRSQASLHRLRIGIKRFRYTVENFLPALHEKWAHDLKLWQDLLGEVHDLDVLWATAVQVNAFPDSQSRKRWHDLIARARQERIEKYRSLALGDGNLWQSWRAELPQDKEIARAALSRLKLWASFLDPDVPHTLRVARLALQLYDGLAERKLVPEAEGRDLRSLLYAAALLHHVGKSRKPKGHHKTSAKLVRRMPSPLGWKTEDHAVLAAVVRFHRGALPQPQHTSIASLSDSGQAQAICLAGILRLASALDLSRNGQPRDLRLEVRDSSLRISVPGYSAYSSHAQEIATARFLLERSLGRPIIVEGQ